GRPVPARDHHDCARARARDASRDAAGARSAPRGAGDRPAGPGDPADQRVLPGPADQDPRRDRPLRGSAAQPRHGCRRDLPNDALDRGLGWHPMSDQRTEAPTQRRIEQARRRGESVGRSHELSMTLTLGAGTLMLMATLPATARQIADTMVRAIDDVGAGGGRTLPVARPGAAIGHIVLAVLPLARRGPAA